MNKRLSCILCWLPLVLFMLAYIPLFATLFAHEYGSLAEEPAVIMMLLMVVVALVAVIAVYAVMIWLIVKVCKNKSIDGGMKVVWIICLYLFNMVTFPIYWFVHLRKE